MKPSFKWVPLAALLLPPFSAAATFSFDTQAIRVSAALGGSALPPSLRKLINNNPTTAFDWTATVDVPWLKVTHAPYIYGSEAPGDSQFMFVAVDITQLRAAQQYTGNVTVSAPGFTTQTMSVYVTMSSVTGLSPYTVDATAVADGKRVFNSLASLLAAVTLQGGDVVQIKATGTYADYVELHGNHSGSPGNPVTIIGVDPARALWDVSNAKGGQSYGIGTYGAVWKLREDSHDIVVKHIEVTGLTNMYKSIKFLDPNMRAFFIFGTNLTFDDMYVHHNLNGFMSTPPALNITVQFSEVAFQGLDGFEHNFYMVGTGTHVRFNYIHDALYGINYKDRSMPDANGLAVEFAYNHVANAQDQGYELDFSKSHYLKAGTAQDALVLGNVIEKGPTSNMGQSIVFGGGANDSPVVGPHGRSGTLQMVNNTVIAVAKQNPLISITGDEPVSASLVNNIYYNSPRFDNVTDTGSVGVSGSNNWFMLGLVPAPGITGSLFGTDPGFVSIAGQDYHLVAGSPAIDAGATPPVPVTFEYGPGEMQGTPRPFVTPMDIGAFEYGLKTAASPCDLNSDGVVNILDVQLMINEVLGVTPCTNDLNNDGVCDIGDVQIVVNAMTTGRCVSP